MHLTETKLGRISTEINSFTKIVNPIMIAELEAMSKKDLAGLATEESLMGEIAKRYMTLCQYIEILVNPVYNSPIDPDVDIPEEELATEETVDEKIPENHKTEDNIEYREITDQVLTDQVLTEEARIDPKENKTEEPKEIDFSNIVLEDLQK